MNENRTALEELQKPAPSGETGRERILSDIQVRDILLDSRIAREIAVDYGVSLSLIKRIKSRTACYFQNRSQTDKLKLEPNMSLVTLPHVAASVGHPAKLTEEEVERIRNDDRKLRYIAQEFGISISTAWRVRNGDYQGRSKTHNESLRLAGMVGGKPLFTRDGKREKQ